MKPIVVFDVDGVLADFTLGFTSMAHLKFPELPKPHGNSMQQTWDFASGTGLWTKEQEDACWQEIGQSSTFWSGLYPLVIEADRVAMRRLSKVADLWYVTARFGIAPGKQTRNWLGSYGFPQFENVIALGDRKGTKVDVIQELKAVAAIDDAPAHLEALDKIPHLSLFKRNWPYNIDSPGREVDSVEVFSNSMFSALKWTE